MGDVLFILLRRLRSPLIALICVYAVVVLGFVLIPGQDDQGRPWHMGFFHAFYFVSFMGSTIGFGEIPYPFTDAQRLWATAGIYATVIAWLYAIGALLSVIQDPAFRAQVTASGFRRAVRRLSEPFYLICGHGDTGALLVRALTETGRRCVVIDIDPERINALELAGLPLPVPALCADASNPETLLAAGLRSRWCEGIIALTDSDAVNLQIAIAATLLNPRVRTMARAESRDTAANMASFNTDIVLNPFETFAGRLALALHSPGMHLLFEWMTGVPHERLREPIFPPRGRWILCGYGRFGKAVHERLTAEGLEVTIIETDPEGAQAPPGTIVGRGTEAETLREAGVEEAVGIVAGTDDDADNLSILITARRLNPELFTVARQNQSRNDALFRAAKLDLVTQRGSVIAHKVFALLVTPLMDDFLKLAERQSNDWANELVSRLGAVLGEEVPRVWTLRVNDKEAPGLAQALADDETMRLGDLLRDPRDRGERLPLIVLMLRREFSRELVPAEDTALEPGDQLLICGRAWAQRQLEWAARNRNVLEYLRSGEEHPSSLLGRWVASRRAN